MESKEPKAEVVAVIRELTAHKTNPANDTLTVASYDAIGPGGAHHLYLISGMDPERHPMAKAVIATKWPEFAYPLIFQHGLIAEAGVNGLTHEAILAVLIDRLECFQAGPYACDENGRALEYLEAALGALKSRTLARMARGVEGTSTV